MLDLYSDLTMVRAQTGIYIELLEMRDLKSYMKDITKSETDEKIKNIKELFEISGDSPADPLAKNRHRSNFFGRQRLQSLRKK